MIDQLRESAGTPNDFYLPCRIGRGGFTSERTFEIPVSNGEALVGLADVEYLLDAAKERLDSTVPGQGQSIPGFVRCHIVDHRQQMVLVEVPSADLLQVPRDALVPIA